MITSRSFWQEKFCDIPAQQTFDRFWGIIIPLLAFAVGECLPVHVFHSPPGLLFVWAGLLTPFPQPLFIIASIGIILLAVWLRWHVRIQPAAGLMAGVFLFNALLALSLTLAKFVTLMVEALFSFVYVYVDPVAGIRINFSRNVHSQILQIIANLLKFIVTDPVHALLGILAALCLSLIIMLPFLTSFVYLRNGVLALRYARRQPHSALHKVAIYCGFLLMLCIAISPFIIREKSWKLLACLHFCTGVDLSHANLSEVYIDGHTDLCNINLRAVYGQSTNLSAADLRGAILSGNFRCVDLRNADLQGADLSEVILIDKNEAILYEEGLGITGARYDHNTRWPRQFSPTANGAILVK